MEQVLYDFRTAIRASNASLLASTITPAPPPHDPGRLYAILRSTNSYGVEADVRYGITYNSREISLRKGQSAAWLDVYIAYYKVISLVLDAEEKTNQNKFGEADWNGVYEAWKELVSSLIKGYTGGHFDGWTTPCLYVAGRYLREFALKADEANTLIKGAVTFNSGLQDDVVGALEKHDKLEDAAMILNRIFGLCISDRAPIEESRKWGVYCISNMMFKTYFKLNSLSLCKNILRSLSATASDLPDLSLYPKSHQVTFNYYVGVLSFLEEDYPRAETHLAAAHRLCPAVPFAHKNRALILTYLIPCRLLTTHVLPTATLLRPYPLLQRLFAPLAACVRKGDLAGFDAALAAGEAEFVRRRIYLTLERGRDIAVRNLCRKVFLAGGWEAAKRGPEEQQGEGERLRRTRIPLAEFVAAIRVGMRADGREGGVGEGGLEQDEVECVLANLIYKNLMKGYISRAHGTVVLSKTGAFPGTGV
ncbi:MAG: COP9 signalosome (CSN) subunit [Bathelium mastoideum]|nr:MAG: COP9 signalosome (CSN) subunit [Bathelium mastoideum]